MGSATAYQAEKYDVVLIALVMFHRMDGSNVGLLPLQLQQTINCPLRTEMKIHLHLLDIPLGQPDNHHRTLLEMKSVLIDYYK